MCICVCACVRACVLVRECVCLRDCMCLRTCENRGAAVKGTNLIYVQKTRISPPFHFKPTTYTAPKNLNTHALAQIHIKTYPSLLQYTLLKVFLISAAPLNHACTEAWTFMDIIHGHPLPPIHQLPTARLAECCPVAMGSPQWQLKPCNL